MLVRSWKSVRRFVTQKATGLGLGLAVVAGSLVAPVRADEGDAIRLPSDTKFVIQLDIEAFRKTSFGGKVFDMVKEKAMEEIANSSEGGKGPDMDKLVEMLGFDPFTEIRSLTLAASDYDKPEDKMVAIVSMKKTTGNLEGLLLSLPGYEGKDEGKYRIHSASPDENTKVYGAVHTAKDGSKSLVVGAASNSVVNLLEQMDGKSSSDEKLISVDSTPGTLLNLQVLDIPTENLGEGPQTNIAKILENLNFRISEESGKLKLALAMSTASDKQAEQLQQMFQGLIAMIGFAQSADPENEELKAVQKFAQDLRAKRDGTKVSVAASFDADEVLKLIEQEINDEGDDDDDDEAEEGDGE